MLVEVMTLEKKAEGAQVNLFGGAAAGERWFRRKPCENEKTELLSKRENRVWR